MKRLALALLLSVAAVVVRYLPSGHFELAWRVDEHTIRGTSSNVIFSWMFLAIALILILVEVSRRIEAR